MPSYRTFIQRANQLERVFVPKLVRIIKAYRKAFINDLKDHGQSTATSNLYNTFADPALIKSIEVIYLKAGLFGARFEYQGHLRWIAQARRQERKAAGFGKNEQWIAEVARYLNKHMIKFVQNITDTMRGDIVRILEKGAEEGWSIDSLVRELRAQGLIEARARVIARTEIIRAANTGHSVAAESLPYEVDKKWSAAKDHRTRHSHTLVNGHIVGEKEFFNVPIYKGDKPTGTFDQMLYPGDPEASPSNTINCRCRVTYIPKRDANGRLVMRNTNEARIIPMRGVPRMDPAQIAAQLKANITISVE